MILSEISGNQAVHTLHRYFIWADRMRVHFDTLLQEKDHKRSGWDIEVYMYMSLWYSQLYVVIEGWNELQLHDPIIDELVQTPTTTLLKRYRHGVCHFQKEYWDKRFLEFMQEGNDAVAWVRSLNCELSRFSLARFQISKN